MQVDSTTREVLKKKEKRKKKRRSNKMVIQIKERYNPTQAIQHQQ
jgi:hypothetical protein